jgi:hypothetical protein
MRDIAGVVAFVTFLGLATIGGLGKGIGLYQTESEIIVKNSLKTKKAYITLVI